VPVTRQRARHSTRPVIASARRAIHGQVMAPGHQQRHRGPAHQLDTAEMITIIDISGSERRSGIPDDHRASRPISSCRISCERAATSPWPLASVRTNDGSGHSVSTAELVSLRAENARLLRLLKLSRREAAPPGPAQAGFFDAPPGAVHAGSPPEVKVASSVRYSPRAPISTRSAGRTHEPGRRGGFPPCAADGAKASRTPSVTTCH
jgi:hypothetical protein